ncbi:hypothetical protein [Thermithiobacillus plumbiphilus]|uniref:TerB family tellurite resistance protein n=1 Tax=Thermithiobacillus plumbiphilus TaxID=1729899 RepID=A0ABU9D5D9_9PROT
MIFDKLRKSSAAKLQANQSQGSLRQEQVSLPDPRPDLKRLLGQIASSLYLERAAPDDPLSVPELDAFIMALLHQRDQLTREALGNRLQDRMKDLNLAFESGNLDEAKYQFGWIEKVYEEELVEARKSQTAKSDQE